MTKHIKKLLFFFIFLMCFSCAKDSDVFEPRTLADFISINSHQPENEVIACAASKSGDNNTSYIFYYPIPKSSEIRYFETSSIDDDKNDFSLYKEKKLTNEGVFNSYLGRFIRTSSTEAWCIVTYIYDGKLYKSNPIKLKNQTKPTEWTNLVSIDISSSLEPKFTWVDGSVKENEIYFQVITDSENNLLSGTYTYDKWFQYYKTSNVVLNVTRETPPPVLIVDNEYNFTMMGVSKDNWVNLVIQKPFTAK